MNPNHKFFISFTACDKVVWGIGRNPQQSESDCAKHLGLWKRHYNTNYRNAKVVTLPASKRLYDIICQYGSYEKNWKMVNGVAELVK